MIIIQYLFYFNQGDGPPPDPKYNFLADSERELRGGDDSRPDEERSRNKASRGGRGRRGGTGGGNGSGGAKEAFFKVRLNGWLQLLFYKSKKHFVMLIYFI